MARRPGSAAARGGAGAVAVEQLPSLQRLLASSAALAVGGAATGGAPRLPLPAPQVPPHAPLDIVKDGGIALVTPRRGGTLRASHGENALWATLAGVLLAPADLAGDSAVGGRAVRHPWATGHPHAGFAVAPLSHALARRLADLASRGAAASCARARHYALQSSRLGGTLLPRTRWDLFEAGDLADVVHAAGPRALACLLSRLTAANATTFSGLPDLVLWDGPESCPCCGTDVGGHRADAPRLALYEVKSSDDVLRPHQLDWLQHLRRGGVEAGMVHVVAD